MKYKCTLLSDLVLNQNSGSEGKQTCLDFIPGNNFLGIVAENLYNQLSDEESALIFHSGKVRFGDAHPSACGIRSLKIPLSMYYPKMGSVTNECYIHHHIVNQIELLDKQLKQCRNGFYIFDEENKKGTKIPIEKSFSIKSAYDTAKRRSEDEMMYGYESLQEGLEMYFEIESDLDAELNKKIQSAILGKKRIGRSRSAQYGSVEIERVDYKEIMSSSQNNNEITVYADGRLIFLNANGDPSFQPQAKDLGLDGGEILWSKCQIRTFQYSPWNGKRHTHDIDRCGIEKGSVFVVNCSKCPENSRYVGFYNNEGFGKVIYNPDFLLSKAETNGRSTYALYDTLEKPVSSVIISTPQTSLISFLKQRQVKDNADSKVYSDVDYFINNYSKLFKGETFASQWGSIRSIAMVKSESEQLIEDIEQYLNHGVAKDRWDERNRRRYLVDFMKKHKENLQDLMINLSSEMAKKCKQVKEK